MVGREHGFLILLSDAGMLTPAQEFDMCASGCRHNLGCEPYDSL
jgi:hypothetical protein